uniref:Putative Metallo-hydrolase/oxidoreductase n=1 Tax=Moniliophthora roreri TaxID=221103 RepID=A0A0W0EUS6_MONRR
MALPAPAPAPAPEQAYCDISALEAGFINLKLEMFLDDGKPGEVLIAPSLSFLVQHSTNGKKLIVDLGLRKDWENYSPINAITSKNWGVTVPQDVSVSLREGGLSPSDIDTICITHVHFDHVGDTKPFTKSTFIVGGEAAILFNPGYPDDPHSGFASDLLPPERTTFLDTKAWSSLGPFPRALDYFGDGSLYIVDAAGHLPGHLNFLARTSSDGGWLLMAGDSAHHWRLITGESQIAEGRAGSPFPGGCAHVNKKASDEHLARIRAFLDQPRTRVIIAHDEPWYKQNKGGEAFWPGKIPSL